MPHDAASKVDAIRASTLYAICAVFIAMGLIHTFSTQIFAPGMTSARLIGLAGVGVFSFCALYFRITGNLRAAGAALLVSTYLVIIITALRNGGAPAPTLPFFAILPLAATILFNRVAGGAAFLAIAVGVGFLFIAPSVGWATPSPHTAEHLRVLFASSVLLTSVGIVVLAFQYEKIVGGTLTEVRHSAEKLRDEIEAHQRRAEALRVAEERFALAAKGASVGIWDWVNVNEEAQYWSDQFYSLLGYEPGEIEANRPSLHSLVHPDDLNTTFEAVEAHLRNEAPFSAEFQLRHKDGNYRWFLGSGQAVWDDAGAPRRMIGTIMDIDDRKRVEIMKTEFVSTVSHELRTPMTSIIGAIDMIRSKKFGALTPRAEKLLDIAAGNGARLVRLLNEILDIAKLDVGKMPIAMDKVDLLRLLSGAVDEMRPFVSQQGAEIELAFEDKGVLFDGDNDRLMQVLINLISNAAKFSGEGGRIVIAATAADDAVSFSVSDNGCGIPASQIDTVFKRFHQLDGSTTRSQDGTGLGLAICKAIVEAHGGRLSVVSAVGEGSTFTATMPLHASAETDEAVAVGA